MRLIHILPVLLLVWAVLRFALLPGISRGLRFDFKRGVVHATSVAAVKFGTEAALLAAIACGIAILTLGGLSSMNISDVKHVEWWLRAVVAIRETVKVVSERSSILVLLFLFAALAWSVCRIGRRKLGVAYREVVEHEVDRIRRERENGKLRDLAPTADMQAVIAHIRALDSRLTSTTEEAEIASLKSTRAKLFVVLEQLDTARRVDVKVGTKVPATTTVMQKIGDFLFSRGMVDTATAGSRLLARVATVLLFLSLIGMSGEAITPALEVREVSLRQLAFHRDAADTVKTAPQATAPPLPDTAATVAQAFNQAFFNSRVFWDAPPPAPSEASPYRAMRVRKRILDAIAEPQVLSQRPSMEDAHPLTDPETAEVRVSDARADGASSGARSVAEEKLKTSGVERTSAWQALARKLDERIASFHELPTPDELGGQLLEESVGHLMRASLPKVEDVSSVLAQKLATKMAKGNITALYEATFDRMVTDIVRGMPVDAALLRVRDSDGRGLATENQLRGVREFVMNELPNGNAVREQLVNAKPHLMLPAAQEEAAVKELADKVTRENAINLAPFVNAVETYEDIAPADTASLSSTPRAKLVETIASNYEPEVANRIRTNLELSPRLVEVAESPIMLGGFAEVGGVVIGQDPKITRKLDFHDLAWSRDGPRMRLELVGPGGTRTVVGTFDGDVVNQALAYVADNRRIAVTMPVVLGHQRRPFFHPALADTPLGKSIADVDTFVDHFNRRNQDSIVEKTTALADLRMDLYTAAWWQREAAAATTKTREAIREEAQKNAVRLVARSLIVDEFPKTPLFVPNRCPSTGKVKAFFDSDVVEAVDQCLGKSRDSLSYLECLGKTRFEVSPHARPGLPPTGRSESGVREQTYTVDGSLSFLTPKGPAAPLRFMEVQLFKAPEFATVAERGAYYDDDPWEFECLEPRITANVLAGIRDNADLRYDFDRTRQFTIAQRLFRTALAGGLGSHFRMESLVALARETRSDVKRFHGIPGSKGR